jgi:hypothetical protein
LLGSQLSRCGSKRREEQLKTTRTPTLQKWRTVREVWADSPRARNRNRAETEHADSPPRLRGQSAEIGQQSQQRSKDLLAKHAKSRRGLSATYSADGPPYTLRDKLSTGRCSTPMGGLSADRARTVRRQTRKTDRVLNGNFKPAQNSNSIQMNSDEAQNSHTVLLDHHEGDPKRSNPKDQSFMFKIQNSGLKLGFSPKGEIERFFKRNRFKPREHPR